MVCALLGALFEGERSGRVRAAYPERGGQRAPCRSGAGSTSRVCAAPRTGARTTTWVASKPGTDGGYNYLVDMAGVTIGYISGSSAKPGTKPEAEHLAVYVNKKGYPATAFPRTPKIF